MNNKQQLTNEHTHTHTCILNYKAKVIVKVKVKKNIVYGTSKETKTEKKTHTLN